MTKRWIARMTVGLLVLSPQITSAKGKTWEFSTCPTSKQESLEKIESLIKRLQARPWTAENLENIEVSKPNDNTLLLVFATHLLPESYTFKAFHQDCWTSLWDHKLALEKNQLNLKPLVTWGTCLKHLHKRIPVPAKRFLACQRKLNN